MTTIIKKLKMPELPVEDAREIFKVAIVGAGYMAREHIRAFQDIPGVSVSGIMGRTPIRAEGVASEFGINTLCRTVTELYEKTAADLVIIAVPELETNQVSCACFDYPWTVLIEKPAGYNLPDAESIQGVACAKHRNVFVALNRRHYSSTCAVLKDLSNQRGTRLIKVQDQEDQIAALKAGQPKIIVDNWMFANSIHLIDYFLMFARGRVCSVEPIIPWNPEDPGFVAAKISFESGDLGLYEAIWNGPGPWAVSISTEKKRWEMRPLEQASFQLAGKRTLEPIDTDEWDVQFKPGVRRQAELAVEAARGKSTILPTLKDSLETMRLTQAIYQV